MFGKISFLLASLTAALLTALTIPATAISAQARDSQPANGGNSCLACHENLYTLHDTGKAYCLNDAPMTCVDCHGGNPSALTQEAAHFNRAAHPVINENDKKCYECHPAQAQARLETFRALAGIPEVLVAQPCPPAGGFPASEPGGWRPGLETLALFVAAGLALVAFITQNIRHG
jgi:hypothetical protein